MLISKVKEYCMAYNVIVNNTTIEGELITFENIDKFLLYIQTRELNKNQKRQHDNIISIADNIEKTYKVICECNGKSECQNSFEVQYKIVGDKTSGWMCEWIDYYFDKHINLLPDTNEKLIQFKKDFPSLSSTLQNLSDMVK